MEKNNKNTYNVTLLGSFLYLISAAIMFLDNKIDKVGVKILYLRLGLVTLLWFFCASALILFFAKKIWRADKKIIPIMMLACGILLSVMRVSYFADAFSDFKNGTMTITTNEYPVVWDKIFFTNNGDDYAFVSEDIAKALNDNNVLTVTSNFDTERENYAEIVYYPKTHILISAEILKRIDR